MAAGTLQLILKAEDQMSAALKGASKEIRGFQKEFAPIKKVLQETSTALAIAGGTITAFAGVSIKGFTDAGQALAAMSARTGIGVRALSELGYALEQSGVSVDSFETGIRQMQLGIAEAERGSGAMKDSLAALHLSLESLQSLSPDQQFRLIAKSLGEVQNATDRAALAQQLFGRSGTQLLPLIGDIDQLTQRARELGVTLDEKAVKAALAMGNAAGELKASLAGLRNTVGEALAPAVTQLTEKLLTVVLNIRKWADEHPLLFQVLATLVASAGAVALALGTIGLAIPPIVTGVMALRTAWMALGKAFATNPLGLIITAVTILAVTLLPLLISHWDDVVSAFMTGVNYLGRAAENLLNAWLQPINLIIDGLNQVGKVLGFHIEKIKVDLPEWKRQVEGVGVSHEDLSRTVEESMGGIGSAYKVYEESQRRIAEEAAGSYDVIMQRIGDYMELRAEQQAFEEGVMNDSLRGLESYKERYIANLQALAHAEIDIERQKHIDVTVLRLQGQAAIDAAADWMVAAGGEGEGGVRYVDVVKAQLAEQDKRLKEIFGVEGDSTVGKAAKSALDILHERQSSLMASMPSVFGPGVGTLAAVDSGRQAVAEAMRGADGVIGGLIFPNKEVERQWAEMWSGGLKKGPPEFPTLPVWTEKNGLEKSYMGPAPMPASYTSPVPPQINVTVQGNVLGTDLEQIVAKAINSLDQRGVHISKSSWWQ